MANSAGPVRAVILSGSGAVTNFILRAQAPPVPPHDFHYTGESIAELTDKLIDKSRKTEDRVAKLKPEECTFESVLLPLSYDEDAFETASDPAIFMQSVSTDKAVRDAATEASRKISVG